MKTAAFFETVMTRKRLWILISCVEESSLEYLMLKKTGVLLWYLHGKLKIFILVGITQFMATENLKTSSLGNMRYQELGHPVFEVEVDATNVQQSGFDSDAYTATSRVFSGAQSLKFEMEEESNKKYKQLRLSHQVQQVSTHVI